MNTKHIRQQGKLTAKWEGYREKAYLDSLGFPTIGCGILITRNKSIMHKDIVMRVPRPVAELWVELELKALHKELCKRVNYFSKLPIKKQMVLTDMAFNLGVNGLLKFKRMWAALKHKNYKFAAKEAKDSRWFTQVGRRAQFNCFVLGQSSRSFLGWLDH